MVGCLERCPLEPVAQSCSVRKGFPRNFTKFIRKHLCITLDITIFTASQLKEIIHVRSC